MYEKEKKTQILSGDFRLRFSAENECPFSFRFRPQMESIFVGFPFTAENLKKMLFDRPVV